MALEAKAMPSRTPALAQALEKVESTIRLGCRASLWRMEGCDEKSA